MNKKAKLTLIFFMFLLTIGCWKKDSGDYTVYTVTIVNNGVSEVKEMRLRMNGAKDSEIAIDILAPGGSSQEYEFKLKNAEPGKDVPERYGDIEGSYVKDGMNVLYVNSPGTTTVIKIHDSYYSVE